MAECVTSSEVRVPSGSEAEMDVYDVPPKRYSKPHNEADYMNFKELEVIPTPMLPPKKSSAIDLDAKFGPSTPLPDADGGGGIPCSPVVKPNSPRLDGTGSLRKVPVPAPRRSSLDSKQPVAPPRKSRADRVTTTFALLPDVTMTDSLVGNSFESYPPKAVVDWCNNNLEDLSNQNAPYLCPDQEDGRCNISLGVVYELEAEPFNADYKKSLVTGVLNAKDSRHDYINTGRLLGEINKLPRENAIKRLEAKEYVNVNESVSPLIPSSVEQKLPDIVTRQTSAPAPSLVTGNDSVVPAVTPMVPRGTEININYHQQRKVAPDTKPEKAKRDYINVNQSKINEYTNVSQVTSTECPGVNVKVLLTHCLEVTRPPSSPLNSAPVTNKLQLGTPAQLSSTTSSGDFIGSNDNPVLPDDPFYELIAGEDTNLANNFHTDPFAELSRNHHSFNCQDSMDICSTSPPMFTPPPLPSGLLIDLTDDDLYKAPSSRAPAVPERLPPPLPARKGTVETQTDSRSFELSNIPVSQNEVQGVVPPHSGVLPRADRKASCTDQNLSLSGKPSQPEDAGGRSKFYVQYSQDNYYETEPLQISYEMDSSTICQPPNNGLTACSQTSTSELTNLCRAGSLDVSHQGFLYLVGSTTKVEKKWCTLDVGCLNICANNQAVNQPLEKIDRVSMVSIANIRDDSRQGNWFEISTRPPSVVYQFSAKAPEEKTAWIDHIARYIALVNTAHLDKIANVERGGNIFVRIGTESEWIHTWIHIVRKTLYIYNKDGVFEEVDLRKSKGLRNLQLSDRCTKGFEMCPPLAVDLPSARVIYIQSDLKKDQDGWYSALLNSMKVIDNSLASLALTADNVPVIVEKCINFVSAFGMEMEGIYRLNGQNSKVTKVLDDFRSDHRGMILRSSEYHIHDVATALKRFFRQLDDPLLTNNLYNGWIEASGFEDQDVRLDAYKSFLRCLPVVNYSTLKRIITHIAQVADLKTTNKMDSTNLASIFGPILLKVDKDNQPAMGYGTTNQEIKIIRDLVDNHRWLFDIKEEELDQEKKIAEAVKRIEQLNMARFSQLTNTISEDGVLLGVYINGKEGDVVTLKVTITMTAEELQRYVEEKTRIRSSQNWALFEVICNGELERPIHHSEKILAVTMKWSEWPLDFCQNNYLCFKFNKLYELLQLVHDPHMSLFSELRYTSKKTFHKFCFQYSQYSLGFRKDTRAENPTTAWHVEDIIIYIGIQRIRNPPTRWGFTFYAPKEKLTSPYFGHSVCCCNEEELCRWLSAMFYSQHPKGFLLPGDNLSPPNNFHKQLTQNRSSPIGGAQNSETTQQPSSSTASKWKLAFPKRR